MSATTLEARATPFVIGSLERQFLAALALTILADWLFFDRYLGISCAAFALAVCAACLACNRIESAGPVWAASLVLVLGLAPMAIAVGGLSLGFALAAVVLFALIVTGQQGASLEDAGTRALRLCIVGPLRLAPDLLLFIRLIRRGRRPAERVRLAANWLVPALFGIAFAGLFIAANPLIEQTLATLDFLPDAGGISIFRLVFWLIISSVVWPYVRVRLTRRKVPEFDLAAPGGERPHAAEAGSVSLPRAPGEPLFSPASIRLSLVVFNLLFAVQTVLDLAYLWGGAELPEGMTYADYAHRGAYPLITTAILAGLFVLIALRPGASSEDMPAIRALVYAWIGQNVLLVISSILRLDLYVEVYALTYWRLAAFIWMALVAVGLLLIVARLALRRSNRWMVISNLMVTGAVLYACAFVNFAHHIATYNVAHSKEVSGRGVALDLDYLRRLGASSIPAIDAFVAHRRAAGHEVPVSFETIREALKRRHLRRLASGWRAWTFRDWRLGRYMEAYEVVKVSD